MTRKLRTGQLDTQSATEDYRSYFYTYDLGAAAALVSAGFQLALLDKTNPNKVQFAFTKEVGMERVMDDYWADRLEVKARSFFDNIKMLKNRLYSE
jgi:hypothetical protein